ncbi:MAG: hypothetical protein H6872_03120 [Methylobacteriaceae bacterium]|nr:hypothetical protein [Methylobacteriaceae bacterium]
MRRLTIVRYLYSLGLDQERRGDQLSGLALLSFHDAVELFLQVAAELHPVTLKRSPDLMEYWPAFAAANIRLPYQEQMRRFNGARVEVKHRGTLPSRHDVEAFRGSITRFLTEAAPILFGIEFDSISLSSLVRSDEIRRELMAAEAAAHVGRSEVALECAMRAFHRTLQLHRYGDPPLSLDRRLFDPTEVASDLKFWGREPGKFGERSRLLEAVANMGERLGEAVTVVAYHLDYDGYRYLQTYGPAVHLMAGGNILTEWTSEPTTDQRVIDRCVAFAVDAALRLEGKASAAPQTSITTEISADDNALG